MGLETNLRRGSQHGSQARRVASTRGTPRVALRRLAGVGRGRTGPRYGGDLRGPGWTVGAMNTGPGGVEGDVRVSSDECDLRPPPGTVTGTTYAAGAAAAQTQNDLTTAVESPPAHARGARALMRALAVATGIFVVVLGGLAWNTLTSARRFEEAHRHHLRIE